MTKPRFGSGGEPLLVPDSDPAAEWALIGGLLHDPKKVLPELERIPPGAFTVRPLREMLPALLEVARAGEPIDGVTVRVRMGDEAFNAAHGASTLAALQNHGVPTPTRYRDRVISLSHRRDLRAAMRMLSESLDGGASPADAAEQLRAYLGQIMATAPKPRALRAYCLEELRNLKRRPREPMCGEWLREKDTVVIHSWRGIGKSQVGCSLSVALSTATPFMNWTVPKRRKVLLVDGEMPADELQERCGRFEEAAGGKLEEWLLLLSADVLADDLDGPSLTIRTADGRAAIERVIYERAVEVLLLDNIATLAPGMAENDSEAWAEIGPWLLRLRHRGVTVVYFSHDGKGGTHRGHSNREDVVTTAIHLKKPRNWNPSEAARFIFEIEKSRSLSPVEPFEVTLGPEGHWQIDVDRDTRIRELHAQGLSQHKIADEVGCGVGTVNRALKGAS